MAHSHHMHREHQVSHRRVSHILKGEPAGAQQNNDPRAFSKVTSKTAAENHGDGLGGAGSPKRFARGGKVKHKGAQTNIAIVMPHRPDAPPNSPSGPTGGLPPGGPPPLPPGMPPGGPGGPGMPMPPMHKRGGKVADGDATKANIKAFAARAKTNSYFRGGAATGVGREEKASHAKGRK